MRDYEELRINGVDLRPVGWMDHGQFVLYEVWVGNRDIVEVLHPNVIDQITRHCWEIEVYQDREAA